MKKREVRVGALYPLSGSEKPFGENIYKALEFYVNLINSRNESDCPIPPPLKHPILGDTKIKLIWADTKGDNSTALKEARRLVEDEGVVSIMGSYQSTVSSAVSFLTEVLKVPYVSAETDAGVLVKRGLRWFFKVGTNDYTYTKALFYMLKENGFEDSDFAVLAEDTLLGQGEAQSVINLSNKYSFPVEDVQLYGKEYGEIKESLSHIKNINPDFIFSGQVAKQPIEVINDLEEIGYYPMGILDQTGEYTLSQALDRLGEKANYVISAVPWAPSINKVKPLSNDINKRFKNIYGSDLDSVNSASITGMHVLVDAIARSRDYTPDNIRKALLDTQIPGKDIIMPWSGIEFDKHGMNKCASSIVVQIHDKKFKIVWPQCLAEAKAILPVPQWNE